MFRQPKVLLKNVLRQIQGRRKNVDKVQKPAYTISVGGVRSSMPNIWMVGIRLVRLSKFVMRDYEKTPEAESMIKCEY